MTKLEEAEGEIRILRNALHDIYHLDEETPVGLAAFNSWCNSITRYECKPLWADHHELNEYPEPPYQEESVG